MRLAFAVITAAALATPVAAQQTNRSNTAAPMENVATSVDVNQQAPPPIPATTAAATEAATDETSAPTRAGARRSGDFPWGLIGLVGLVGLLGRRRS